MATVRDVVDRSLRLLGVVSAGVEPTAQEAADGLEALNTMLAGWKAHGVDVSHVDYVLTDTFETATLTAEYRDATTALLAVEMAPEFETAVNPALARSALDGWRILQANFLVSENLVVPLGLRRMPSRYSDWYW